MVHGDGGCRCALRMVGGVGAWGWCMGVVDGAWGWCMGMAHTAHHTPHTAHRTPHTAHRPDLCSCFGPGSLSVIGSACAMGLTRRGVRAHVGETPPLRFGTWGPMAGTSGRHVSQSLTRYKSRCVKTSTLNPRKRKLDSGVSPTRELKPVRKQQVCRMQSLPRTSSCKLFVSQMTDAQHFAAHSGGKCFAFDAIYIATGRTTRHMRCSTTAIG